MKVALYLPSLNGGGVERVMVTLANAFAERGYHVDLVLATAQGPFLKLVSSNVNLVDLGCKRVLTSLPALICYLRNSRPVILLSAMNYVNVIAVAAKYLAQSSAHLLVSEHSTLATELQQSKSWRFRSMPLLTRFAYLLADKIIAVSQGVADEMATIAQPRRDKVQVIYNPITSISIVDKANQSTLHPWFERGQPPVILGAGRLTYQKDFATLIHAFAIVKRKTPSRLVILGEGNDLTELTRLVRDYDLQDYVDFPGFIDNPYSYMKQSSVFVLSSRYEGFGNVLVEAMACGVPVIATDCPSGPAEILQNGLWGELVPVSDSKAMANAIIRTITASSHPDVTRRAADFSIETSVDKYIDAFQALVQRDGNRGPSY